jgi:hypothetical protein
MLPSIFDAPLKVDFANSKPLSVVATGATIAVVGDMPAISVTNGGNVKIRGLTSTSERHIICGQQGTTATSSLSMDDSVLSSLGNMARLEVRNCKLRITRSEMKLNAPSGLLDDADVELDRVHISGTSNNLDLFQSARVRLTVTNSLLENVYVNDLFPTDTGPPGSHFVFAYDTFVQDASIDMCSGETYPFRTVLFENSIVVNTGTRDAFDATNPANCTFLNTIAYPQAASAPMNTIVSDPQFVNAVGGDFHLKASSPAIDAAMGGMIDPGPDLDGNARPLGAKPDLGAYERAP